MASATTDCNVARRMLSLTLEGMRTKQGISRETAAAAISIARSTLWKLETGQAVRLNPVLLERLCELYEAEPQQTQVVLELVKETKATGWWQAFSDDAIPKEFGLFVSMEDAAERSTSYQTMFLPGLLHTADYRRAHIWAEFPNKPTHEVERAVEANMKRQERLACESRPLTINAFIDEAALRNMTGSRSIMEAQLCHLLNTGTRNNVTIRVIPRSVGINRAMIVGSFVILDFPRHAKADLTMPPVVYIEGYLGDLYLEQPQEVRRYREICTDLDRLALNEKDSRKLILQIAKEYA
jgi:transcriptional regulator with XRE-family HTH domain